MELRVLKYFLEVARTQNITAAAERLHLTQPTLSKQLMELESELGVKLLDRGKRKTTLTDDGALLYRRASEIVELAEMTERSFLSRGDELIGDVSIGCGETPGMKLLIDAMKALTDRHPDVKFHLYSGNDEDVTMRLDGGLIDFGLFVGSTALDNFDYLTLPVRDSWGLLMRDDCPLSARPTVRPSDISSIPLLCSRQALNSNELSGWLGKPFSSLDIVSTHNLVTNAAMMAEAGMGCVLTIAGLVNTAGTRLTFRPLDPPMTADLVFAHKKSRPLSRPAEAFLEAVKQEIARRS